MPDLHERPEAAPTAIGDRLPASPTDGWLPETDSLDESDYEPMPPKRSFQMRVRFTIRGRGEPLEYPLDDLDLEPEP